MPEPGTFMWNQLVTDDQATAGKFYSELFGWHRNEVDAGPLGVYTVFQLNGKDVAGMMNPTARSYGNSPPPRWVASRATALGARMLEPPHEIPGVGRISMFGDPVGALVYVLRPERPSQ